MKLYVAYRMASLPVTYCDLEGYFCCVNPFFISHKVFLSGTAEARVVNRHAACIIYDMFRHNWKAHMAL